MSRIVAVHSFRGGTGKSNLTANLAASIASHGKRVAVVDTDLASPGIHVIFGLAEGDLDATLNDYLWGKCPVVDAAYDVSDRLQQADEGGRMFVVPSSMKPAEIARVLRDGYDVAILNDGFNALLDELALDVLLVDTHPGVNEETLLSMAVSQGTILLLRPDQQDFQGTAVTVELARQLEVPELLLVLNKYLPGMGTDKLRASALEAFGAELDEIIPLSEEMLHLGSGGIFSVLYPDHEYSRCIANLAQRILRIH